MKKEKSIDEVLQEEFLRERAAVLAKAGEKLTKTLHQLAHIEESIAKDNKAINCLTVQLSNQDTKKKMILEQINQHVDHFNRIREKAKVQYYDLIVTREAMGLRKHHWVEELYSIPHKKKSVKDK